MQATRLVTASEDDMSPVIMVWDLRNARAPEKVSWYSMDCLWSFLLMLIHEDPHWT